jgi:hypothetical protein
MAKLFQTPSLQGFTYVTFRPIRPSLSPPQVLAVTYVDISNVTLGIKLLTSKPFLRLHSFLPYIQS